MLEQNAISRNGVVGPSGAQNFNITAAAAVIARDTLFACPALWARDVKDVFRFWWVALWGRRFRAIRLQSSIV